MRFVPRTLALALLAGALGLAACDDEDPTEVEIGVPSNVTATALTPTSVRVAFGAVSGATSYSIERAESAGGFAALASSTTNSYEDTGVDPNTQYRYRVAAVSGSRVSAFSTEAAVTTPLAGPKVATINSDITAARTLYADTTYTLSGFIHVQPGATLTIQPGTKIQGDFNTLGSALFIMRGAKIMAEGTAEAPIVFTSSQPENQRRPGDWGGVIIIGNGIINRSSPVNLEGTGTGETNPLINYAGGTDNSDNSGVLRYVRIEFAGFGPVQDAELNSLTLAAVGSGTTIDYVQTMSGLDDSFEWFGGAVDGRHLVSYESGDDHFDASEGYVGRNQYLIAFQSKQLVPRSGAGGVSSDPQGFEVDGCSGSNCPNGQASTPFNIPVFANFTVVGTGSAAISGSSGGVGMVLRRGTGGFYVNGVVARWPRAAIAIRDAATSDRLQAGELMLSNILLSESATRFEGGSGRFAVDTTAFAIHATASAAASLFTILPTDPSSGAQFDWTPPGGSAAASGGLSGFSGAIAARAGSFVTATGYRGAADPAGPKWWAGWTSYANN